MSNLRVDIVSDVVCPWCIIGYQQFDQALRKTTTEAEVHWHPFELNPEMPPEGQNLTEHICEKYGMTAVQCDDNRTQLIDLGEALDFTFSYSASSRMVNTFKAHQLLHWLGLQGREHELKMALFSTYFTEQADINDTEVLLDVLSELDTPNTPLDRDEAREVLDKEKYAADVRERETFWTSQGIQGVPAMVFNQKYLVSGAQGVEHYVQMIEQINSAD